MATTTEKLKEQLVPLRQRKGQLVQEMLGVEHDMTFSETKEEYHHLRAKVANRKSQISRISGKIERLHRLIQNPRLRDN